MNLIPDSVLSRIAYLVVSDNTVSPRSTANLRLVNKKFCGAFSNQITKAAPRTLQASYFSLISSFRNLKELELSKLYYTCFGQLWTADDIFKDELIVQQLSCLQSLSLNSSEIVILSRDLDEKSAKNLSLKSLSVDGVSQLGQLEILSLYVMAHKQIEFLSLSFSGVGESIELHDIIAILRRLSLLKSIDISISRATIDVELKRLVLLSNLRRFSCHRSNATHAQLCQFVSQISSLESLTLGELREDEDADEVKPSFQDWQLLNRLSKFTVSVIDGASIRALKNNKVTSLQSLGAMSLFCPSYTLEKFGIESVQTLNLCSHGKHRAYHTQEMNGILEAHPFVHTICLDVVKVDIFPVLWGHQTIRHLVLDLYDNFDTCSKGLHQLKGLQSMKLLQFQNTKLNLKRTNKDVVQSPTEQQLKTFFDNVCELTQLNALKIEFPVQLNSSIFSLTKMPQLYVLELMQVEEGNDISFLSDMSNLFTLTLNGKGISGFSSLDSIVGLKFCKSLDVRGILLPNEVIRDLGAMTQLISLKVRMGSGGQNCLEKCVRYLESQMPLLRQMTVST
eukprot:TRINITY_DN944_c0_g1_i3.p1 TRINITY_DN944_c0_g1~~TRINITY_DN944_c0_g1_i3.p1  ORF type:complete len:564 (+),score=25.85 TRINITY_DN944_c0_g1_i3:29-1720(+)